MKDQPGAAVGDQVYCPVSGVVFEATAESATRQLSGKPLFFCCEACAAHFSENEARLSKVRGYR